MKYYEDFQQPIHRPEAEKIGGQVLCCARQLHPDFVLTIVGSYRRGETASGDVDLILSHKSERITADAIEKIVVLLENENFITHTLSLWRTNSQRGQMPIPVENSSGKSWSGFDSLDKALVVWKDPKEVGALHRRVDIIVSPWKTVGCAVLAWSGETTFQRDLRRYCKEQLHLKFDSSGIRDRRTGLWVDFESSKTPAPDMMEAERRVFAALGLTWISPAERCTG